MNAIENALAGGEAVVVATLINSGKLSRLATGAKILIPKFSEGEGSFGDLKIDELIINSAREIH